MKKYKLLKLLEKIRNINGYNYKDREFGEKILKKSEGIKDQNIKNLIISELNKKGISKKFGLVSPTKFKLYENILPIKNFKDFLAESIDDKKLEQIKKIINLIYNKFNMDVINHLVDGLSLSKEDYIEYEENFKLYNNFGLEDVLRNNYDWRTRYNDFLDVMNTETTGRAVLKFGNGHLFRLPFLPEPAKKYYDEVVYNYRMGVPIRKGTREQIEELDLIRDKIVVDFIKLLKGKNFTFINFYDIFGHNKFLNVDGFETLYFKSTRSESKPNETVDLQAIKSTGAESIVIDLRGEHINFKNLAANFPNLKELTIETPTMVKNPTIVSLTEELPKTNNLEIIKFINEYNYYKDYLDFGDKKLNKDISLSINWLYLKYNANAKKSFVNILNYFDKTSKIIIGEWINNKYPEITEGIEDALIRKKSLKVLEIALSSELKNEDIKNLMEKFNLKRQELSLPPILIKRHIKK